MGLYRGISSNIVSSAPISAVYTFTYESVKKNLLPLLPKEYHSLAHCMAGGYASISTSFIFTPSERIKQQMQVRSHYQNSWKSLIGVLQKGVLPSLYAGWRAVLYRNVPHSAIKVTRETYIFSEGKSVFNGVQYFVTYISGITFKILSPIMQFYTYEDLKENMLPLIHPFDQANIFTTWLTGRHKRPLYEALEKVKAELMILGFISQILMFSQYNIAAICIPVSVADTMLPCLVEQPKCRLLYNERIILAVKKEPTCKEGRVPIISVNGLHQIHILIFFLVVMHVAYCGITMALGRFKIRRWKQWEQETTSHSQEFSNGFLMKLLLCERTPVFGPGFRYGCTLDASLGNFCALSTDLTT